ncbi:MAG TPA: hypothetical protein IGS31_01890, partial [Oscillatoriales cyanobacterium M4454_W2019_049]|nr:hypothetical protein [Oscillatoriales cyanobacterium M4454_W2019_049]
MSFDMKTPDRPPWFLLSLLLLGIGLGLWVAFNPGNRMATESIAIPLCQERSLVSTLYIRYIKPMPIYLGLGFSMLD